jgi:Tol biopolymer transport system component
MSAVIHHDGFKVPECLPAQRFNALPQARAGRQGGDHHRYQEFGQVTILARAAALRFTVYCLHDLMMKLASMALAATTMAAAQTGFLSNIHQLTHGGENAEAYWAPDGKRLVFQSTRPPYECDQIFIMNADGSNQHLVSTGKGRTTCAYFLADNKHIVYASTHLAAPGCPANPDRSRGYLWGVFAGYDIFLATDTGKILKRLTDTPGYDAEDTVNWKTGNIVYTSLASGDLDLWTMKTDGSHKKQLTKTPGYDGGAVYSRDGTKLAWRASYPKTAEAMKEYKSLLADNLTAPMKMELMVADADGSHAHAITDFGCASFAPTFTPDGRQILFSSNKHNCDSRYFELYLINVDGTGLQQVTNFGGFTSFPEFSPDGRTLVFCSDHDAKERYEFNIFTATWKQ